MATLAERGVDGEALVRELTRDEGLRLKPYRCTAGKLTIGVGRNLDDVGLLPSEPEILLRNDIERTAEELDVHVPWWRGLDPVRQRALLNWAFNVGVVQHNGKLLTFKNSLELIRTQRWLDAAQHMMASKWAKQVGPRAERLALMMRDGGAS